MKIPSIAELVDEAMATERFSAHSPQEHAIRLTLLKVREAVYEDSSGFSRVIDQIDAALKAPNA